MPPALPVAAFAESYGSDVMLAEPAGVRCPGLRPDGDRAAGRVGSDPVLPSDPGIPASGVPLATVLGQGGYVDLFYRRYTGVPVQYFAVFGSAAGPVRHAACPCRSFWGQPLSSTCRPSTTPGRWLTNTTGSIRTACSATRSAIDQGTNGIDDNGANGVDDVAERETSPPYPVPLRGIQVRLRIIDRDTRQVRQMTVSSDFIPE